VFPAAIVQTCVIHLIRGTFRYASRRYWDELSKDLKPVYQAPTVEAAAAALDALEDKRGTRYPAMIRLWRNAWREFIPFLDYTSAEVVPARARTGSPASITGRPQ